MRTLLLLILFSLGYVGSVLSQVRDSTVIDESKISKTVENYINQNSFSGTILVAKNSRTIFHKSYGLAYRSTPDTIQNQYRYSIASVTKLFTSIRILQLQEEGTLSLDKPVVDYLPDFKAQIPEQVTLHHLLLHTSGLPEEKDRVYQHKYKPADMAREVLSYKSKNTFGQFNYNNLDYILLGLVIENLKGQIWEKEIEEAILTPLNMNSSGFLSYGYYPRNFAYTYSKRWNGLKQDPLLYIENFYSAGSMYSTTSDLLKLDQALYSNQLLTDEGLKLLAKSYPEHNHAGYGVWNYKYPYANGKPTIMERRGKILGANVVLVRLTDENYTIIILSNDNRFNPDSFGDDNNLREILIRKLYE
jgi:CubicO group peptidase (beta-lactamase class C family)